jgi:hypothetical protein
MKTLVLLFLFSLSAQASETGPYAGLGTFFQNMMKVTNSETASRDLLGEAYAPEVLVGYRVWHLFPAFGWTVFGRKSNEGDKKRYVMRLDLPYLFPYSNELELKAGLGMFFYRIRGEGGSVSIRNGGSTSTFYVPSGNRSSAFFYFSGGAGLLLRASWRLDFDVLLGEPLSRRRSFNLSLRGGYVF